MPVPKSAKGKFPSDSGRARRTGIILFAAFIVLAGLLGTFFVWSSSRTVALGEDHCPRDRAHRPPRVVIILFDQTDRLSELHRKALQTEFRKIVYQEFESEDAQQRHQFSRIEIYSFRSKAGGGLEINPKLQLCNPGSVTALTKWTANPAQVRKRFEQQFLERLDKELADLMEFKESGQSPILETIKHVSLSVFSLPRYDKSEKRLLIASDMLHNTAELKQHQLPQRSYAEFVRTAYGTNMRSDLKGVEVQILLFSMQPQLQTDQFMESFWASYFASAGVVKRNPFAKRIP